jgi:hypothetical protein
VYEQVKLPLELNTIRSNEATAGANEGKKVKMSAKLLPCKRACETRKTTTI